MASVPPKTTRNNTKAVDHHYLQKTQTGLESRGRPLTDDSNEKKTAHKQHILVYWSYLILENYYLYTIDRTIVPISAMNSLFRGLKTEQ